MACSIGNVDGFNSICSVFGHFGHEHHEPQLGSVVRAPTLIITISGALRARHRGARGSEQLMLMMLAQRPRIMSIIGSSFLRLGWGLFSGP